MTYDELWTTLCNAGIQVALSESRQSIRVTHAKNLTDGLRDALRLHKAEIIDELSQSMMMQAVIVFGGIVTDENDKPLKNQPTRQLIL